MGRVYLHVGTMKSGTSYLQAACNRNRAPLAAHGIDWYGTKPTNRAVQDLLASKRLLSEFKGAWAQLAKMIRESDRDTLISMEMLGPAGSRRLRRIAQSLEPHELHLIITLRDLTAALPSHWQELTRNRFEGDWSTYCELVCATPEDAGLTGARFWRHYNVRELIRRWSAIVPEHRMTVVTVPRGATEPDLLWSRFASVLGVPTSALLTPGRVNQSMGAVSAELMRRINARTWDLDWQVYQRGFKQGLALESLNVRAQDEPRLRLSPAHQGFLRDWTVETVRIIEDSGVSVVGDLNEVVPVGGSQSYDASSEIVTEEQLLAAAVDGLVELGRQHGELCIERDILGRRLNGPSAPPSMDSAGVAPANLREVLKRVPFVRWAVRRLRALQRRLRR